VVTLLFVEELSPVRIRLATQSNQKQLPKAVFKSIDLRNQ